MSLFRRRKRSDDDWNNLLQTVDSGRYDSEQPCDLSPWRPGLEDLKILARAHIDYWDSDDINEVDVFLLAKSLSNDASQRFELLQYMWEIWDE